MVPTITCQVGEGVEIGGSVVTVTQIHRGKASLKVEMDSAMPLARIGRTGVRRYLRSFSKSLKGAVAIGNLAR